MRLLLIPILALPLLGLFASPALCGLPPQAQIDAGLDNVNPPAEAPEVPEVESNNSLEKLLAGVSSRSHVDKNTSIDPALPIAVLVAMLVVLVVILAWTYKTGAIKGAETTRVIGLVVVVFGALFLFPAGWSAEQVAPMFGLLGSVAGYLLAHQAPRQAV